RAVLDDEALVHVGLAHAEARIPEDVERDLLVGEADREVLAAAGAKSLRRLAGPEQRDAPLRQQFVDKRADQRHWQLLTPRRPGPSAFSPRQSSTGRTPRQCRG